MNNNYKKKIDLVILAGGRGARIKKFTKKIPKPLIKIKNLSFIKHLLNYFSKYDFSSIYILAGYKGKKIKKEYNKKIINLIPIKCLVEKKKLGTAGALSQLKTKNNLMVINGDSFSNLNINSFINKDEKNYYAKMLLLKNTNYKSNNKLSNLRLEKKTKFISFGGKLMNGGIYLFKNQVLKIIKKKYSSLEEEVIPSLIKKKKIKGFFDKNYFIDIGTYTNLNLAKNNLNKFFRRPAAFLDRDGVINENKEYVCEEKRFFLKKNVLKAIKYLNKKKIYVFIITNQAGIGKGYYTEEKFLNFQSQNLNYNL
jgi:NDP-sugar pyrophosphorylase family protein